MPQRSVEFFFDLGSLASYLAWTQLPRLCADAGAALVYKPMLLGGVFQATGNASPMAVPAKGRYVAHDMARAARRFGVPLVMNPHFPIMTLTLMRGATAIQRQQPERFDAYLAAAFEAIWVDAKNMNDAAVTAEVLQAAGFEPDSFLALVTDPVTKAALKATTDEAIARGVFGAPTMFIGGEMFFGQDRLDWVEKMLLD